MHIENIQFQLFMQIQKFKKNYTDLKFIHIQNEKYKNLYRIKPLFVFIGFYPESILILKTLV